MTEAELKAVVDGVRAAANVLAVAMTTARNAGLTVGVEFMEVDMSTLDGEACQVVANTQISRVTTQEFA